MGQLRGSRGISPPLENLKICVLFLFSGNICDKEVKSSNDLEFRFPRWQRNRGPIGPWSLAKTHLCKVLGLWNLVSFLLDIKISFVLTSQILIYLYFVFAVLVTPQRCFVLSWWNLLQSILRLLGSKYFSIQGQVTVFVGRNPVWDNWLVLQIWHEFYEKDTNCKLL